eukprot:SAG31_NODE_12259_length_955_cov_0.983645_2_plen_154_part_01
MVFTQNAQRCEPMEGDKEGTARREKLQRLTLSQLQSRAVEIGVSAHAIEEAVDSDDPNSKLVELVASHEFGKIQDLMKNQYLFSVEEMQVELMRLQRDASVSVAPVRVADASGLCPLPTCIPDIPPGMLVSEQMHVLVDRCLKSKNRVGFHGM